MPPSMPEQEPGPWTAGLADRWEQKVTWSWSALIYGQSGEEVNRRTKKRIENWLSDNLLDDDLEQSEGERAAKGVLAGVVKTATDVALDMVVTPVLDPGTIPRGIMRTGTASAQGMEDIEQGKTLEGTMKIVGEVSSVALMILAPVRAGGVKQLGKTADLQTPRTSGSSVAPARIGPAEPSMTMFLERGGVPKNSGELIESKTAHNVAEVNTPKEPAPVRTHAVKAAVGEPGQERYVAQAKEYTSPVDLDKYDSFTRPMTTAEAQRSVGAMDRALQSTYGGVPGGLGPFSNWAEHCATHAAAVARAGGIWTTGRLGPHVNFYLFKYMSPLGAQNMAALTAQAQVENTNYPR
jgi:hypothetical protein